ncbi:hypothetical protein F4678DRAFT_457078 [Xylaria arbuscula]|nr:hypothetical protein F4678DRAFT_457078 [Xylaria arbuscula]
MSRSLELLSDIQSLHITPNALNGLLATFAQLLRLKAVDSAIGQVKSLRSLQKKSIDDCRVVDAASRGAWGSVQLLAARKGGWIASSEAAVAIAALAMHTFFQEELSFDAVYSHNMDAFIPIARYINGTRSKYVGNGGLLRVLILS